MELVNVYNRLHIIDRVHYITMESIIHEIYEMFKGRQNTIEMQLKMKSLIEENMLGRGLNRYFQVELSFNQTKVGVKVHEVNPFHRPKECVIWN